MTDPVQLLVVEDDDAIAEPLVEALEREGFGVARVATGGAALAALAGAAGAVDLVLLDLGLPDLDGNEVCRRLRAEAPELAIVVVTARSAELDRVLLLELGADDYVVKPFGLRELVARIRAVLRRTRLAAPPLERERATGEPMVRGALVIDPRRRAVSVADRPVDLTPKEFDLLAFLASEPGIVRTRSAVIEEVWDAHWWGPTKTLDVHMASLRRKLGDPRWVETLRGVGFRFVTLDAPAPAGASGGRA